MNLEIVKTEKFSPGKDCARRVCAMFETRNVDEIARRAGVEITEESWQPVTFGEYHRKTKRIVVNANAPATREKIVAHELGHFFWQWFGLGNNNGNADEESFCDEFAAKIVND